ncbi:MAG: DNA repair protein RecN [bacterium]
MISYLAIHNLAIVDALECELEPGLNVFTGETGAGKSLVVDAIALLLGGRGQADLVGSHGDVMRVEATLELPSRPGLPEHPAGGCLAVNSYLQELGIEEGALSLAREINRAGRSRTHLNGRLVPLSLLRDALAPLVHLHGQQEHEALLSPLFQLNALDRFAGADALTERDRGEALRTARIEMIGKIASLSANLGERQSQEELWRYELEEIEKASLREGEDQTLEEERVFLRASSRIRSTLEAVASFLTSDKAGSSLLDGLERNAQALQDLAGHSPALTSLSERLAGVSLELGDFYWDLSGVLDRLEANPGRLEQIEGRLDQLARLKRKHGGSLAAVRAARLGIQTALSLLEAKQAEGRSLEGALKENEATLTESLGVLRAIRREAAGRLAERVEESLGELGIEHPVFRIELEEFSLENLRAEGLDRVEFLFSANPGEPPRSLTKVASGGELSRLMLAAKAALADRYDASTLVFDEIDAGIGGRVGEMLAAKLVEVSRSHQVICITHLPQIAARAGAHFLLQKDASGISSHVSLQRLGEKERVGEISRMLGGSRISEAVRQHAEELLHTP